MPPGLEKTLTMEEPDLMPYLLKKTPCQSRFVVC